MDLNGVHINGHEYLSGQVGANMNGNMTNGNGAMRPMMLPLYQPQYIQPVSPQHHGQALSPGSSSSTSSNPSAAASFFAR